jgi:hypothetical protein
MLKDINSLRISNTGVIRLNTMLGYSVVNECYGLVYFVKHLKGDYNGKEQTNGFREGL